MQLLQLFAPFTHHIPAASGHDPRHGAQVWMARLPLATACLAVLAFGLGLAFPGHALDLVAFSEIDGPMAAALAQIAALGPGIKALVGFVGFVVALISLAALRNFGPVLFYVGLAIFGAVGLVIAGAIMGAEI
jgi:hypothetical protein